MRALALALVPLFACFVSAADNPILEKAVKHFKSRDPAQREAASRAAIDEARKALAPLVQAMEDPDPEVRRRARDAILSLVPRKAEEPKNTPIQRGGGLFIMPRVNAQRFALQNFKAVLDIRKHAVRLDAEKRAARLAEQALQIRLVLDVRERAQDLEKKEKELCATLGLRGELVVSVVNQRGRRMELSYRVTSVAKESPAARLGVRTGDIIREVNGLTLSGRHPFYAILGDKHEIKKLKVIRGALIVDLAKL